MPENVLSYAIRGAAFKVHTALGPGLLESVYETALAYELRQEGFTVLTQLGSPLYMRILKWNKVFGWIYSLITKSLLRSNLLNLYQKFIISNF